MLHVLAEATCCACVFAQGARGHISPAGSLSPYKNRGERGCLAAQARPKLVQTSQRLCPNHQLCTGDKAQERCPCRAAQCALPSPSNPSPSHPILTPIPRTPQQMLPYSSNSPKEDQARRSPSCSVAVAGWPGPFLCQKRPFYGELLFWICDFSNLSFHVSRHEGMLHTGHAMSCADIAFGFRPRMVQAPQVSCPPALSRHKPFLIREK